MERQRFPGGGIGSLPQPSFPVPSPRESGDPMHSRSPNDIKNAALELESTLNPIQRPYDWDIDYEVCPNSEWALQRHLRFALTGSMLTGAGSTAQEAGIYIGRFVKQFSLGSVVVGPRNNVNPSVVITSLVVSSLVSGAGPTIVNWNTNVGRNAAYFADNAYGLSGIVIDGRMQASAASLGGGALDDTKIFSTFNRNNTTNQNGFTFWSAWMASGAASQGVLQPREILSTPIILVGGDHLTFAISVDVAPATGMQATFCFAGYVVGLDEVQ